MPKNLFDEGKPLSEASRADLQYTLEKHAHLTNDSGIIKRQMVLEELRQRDRQKSNRWMVAATIFIAFATAFSAYSAYLNYVAC